MHTRSDQVQAHRFLSERLIAALVLAEPDAAEHPLRRTSFGLAIGLLIAALIAACVGVVGLFFPSGGSKAWRAGTSLVLEEETGTRYVFAQGQLHPVLNEASASLLLGAGYQVDSVSRDVLREFVHGTPVGIVGAPDALPGKKDLAADNWVVCSDANGLSVRLGADRNVGKDTQPIPNGSGLVVRAGSRTYLIWHDRRFLLNAPWVAGALGLEVGTAPTVRMSWLNTVAAGPNFGRIEVDERGTSGPVLDGKQTLLGQLFVVRTPGTPDRYFLLEAGGLRRVSETGVALVLGDPVTREAYPNSSPTVLPLTAAALTETTVLPADAASGRWPQRPPTGVTDTVPCVEIELGTAGEPATTQLVHTAVGAARPVADAPGVTRDSRVADRISAVPGSGALVRSAPDGSAYGSAFFLITEAGVKYPLASARTAEALGYSPQRASGVPPALLALLPTGPALRPLSAGGQ